MGIPNNAGRKRAGSGGAGAVVSQIGVAGRSCLPIIVQAATTSGPYEVKSVLISGQGAHIEVAPNPPICTSNWAGTQFLLQRTQPHYADGLSTILAAHTANRPVIFWWDAVGSGDCSFLNQLKIDALQVKK